jgi:HlyD family secretion protein
VSETVSRGGKAGQQEDTAVNTAPGETRRSRRGRRAAVVVLALLVLGTGAGVAWSEGVFRSPGSGTAQGGPPSATWTVTRQDLSSQVPVNATLGYAGSYTVQGKGGGALTSLPSAGQVIRQGQVLYRVDNASPVALLYGPVPAWRTLFEGLTGADVSQLNHDLVALGYVDRSDISSLGWDYFSWETAYGVQQMESALGVSSPPGSLALGSVVFEPAALRVSHVLGSLGGPAGGPVMAATSDRHVVTVPLDTSQQSQVAVGDAVTVTLPDGASTPGKISSVGTVASGTADNATIQVTVTLTHPSVAGRLDQAPVTVYITTASVTSALVVPVTALQAQSSGGYAVEVAGPGNTRRLVLVKVGIFNDSSGLVQVTGALTPGQQVVVPAS